MSALINRVGPVVTGSDFFGREVEVQRMVDLLRRGDHISLIAQRRIGKSSLLREVQRRVEPDMVCLYVDLQDCLGAADAIAALTEAAHAHTRLRTRALLAFQNLLGSVEEVGGELLRLKLAEGLQGDWRHRADRVVADLLKADAPLVIMLDELPVLLVRLLRDGQGRARPDGHEQADRLLSWLRRAALGAEGRLRLVLTGSIGLHPIAHQAGLSGTLNIYAPFSLTAWEPATAIQALRALAKRQDLQMDDAAVEEVVARLGVCIPYHVQLFFSQLDEDAKRRRSTVVGHLDVQRVYTTRLLSSHGHVELAHMEERLRLVVPATHLALVIDLLSEAAVVGSLRTPAAAQLARHHDVPAPQVPAVLDSVFGVLEHDGYLERGPDGQRRFVSALLRDWWRSRHGELYRPADQRGEP